MSQPAKAAIVSAARELLDAMDSMAVRIPLSLRVEYAYRNLRLLLPLPADLPQDVLPEDIQDVTHVKERRARSAA